MTSSSRTTSITKKVSKTSKTTKKKKSVREEEIIDQAAAQEEEVLRKEDASERPQPQGSVSEWQFEDALKSSVMAAAKQKEVAEQEKESSEVGVAVQQETSVTETHGMKMSQKKTKKVSVKKTVISKTEELQSGEEAGDEEEPPKPEPDTTKALGQKVPSSEGEALTMEQKSSAMAATSTKKVSVSAVRDEADADSGQVVEASPKDAVAEDEGEDAAEALVSSGVTDVKKKKKVKVAKKTERVVTSPGSDAAEKVAVVESKTTIASQDGKGAATVIQQSVETAAAASEGAATAEAEQTSGKVSQKIVIAQDVQPQEGTTTETESKQHHFQSGDGEVTTTTTTSTTSSSGSKKIVKKRVVTKKTTVTAKGEAAPLYEDRTSEGEIPVEQGPIITESEEPEIAAEPSTVIEEVPEVVEETEPSPVIEEEPGDEEVIQIEEEKPLQIEEAGDDEVQEVQPSGIREISTAIVTEPEDHTDKEPKEREEVTEVSRDQDRDTTQKETPSKKTKKVVVKQKVAVQSPKTSGNVQSEQTQGKEDDKFDRAVKESFMQEQLAGEEQTGATVIKKKKVVKKKVIKVGRKTEDAEKEDVEDETTGEEPDRSPRKVSFQSHERASVDKKTISLQDDGNEQDQTFYKEGEAEASGYQQETTEVTETISEVREPSDDVQQKVIRVTTKKVKSFIVNAPSDDSKEVLEDQPTIEEQEQPKNATIDKEKPDESKPVDEADKPKKKPSVHKKVSPKEEEPTAPFAVKLKKASRVKHSWDDDKLETVDLKHHEFEKIPQEEIPEREGMVVASDALTQETAESEQAEGQKKLKLKKKIKSKAVPKLEANRDIDEANEPVEQAPDEPMEVDSVEPSGIQEPEQPMVSMHGA